MKKSSRLILIALLFTLNTATFGQGPALDTKGQWVTTKPSGCQAFTWFEGNVQMEWTGGCKNGRLNGVGSLKMFDEGVSVISGELSYTEGRAEGRGDLKYTNLGTYVGEFKNSKFNGIGVFTLQDGRKIVGEFREGDPDGKAIEYNPNGSISDSGIYEKGKLITSQYIDPKIFQRVNTGTVVVEGKRVSEASSDVGANWIQDKTTGCKTFNPSPSPEHSVKIIGNCADGYLQGQGVVIWYRKDKQSAKSEGAYVKGRLVGKGVETYPDGRKYVGEFNDSDYNGQGTLTYTDGKSYVGEFKDGSRNGQGTYTFTNGNKYIGGFKDGNYAGQGTFTYADGSKYIGEFKDNDYEGQGILYEPNGSVRTSGLWKNGKPVTPNSESNVCPPPKTEIIETCLKINEVTERCLNTSNFDYCVKRYISSAGALSLVLKEDTCSVFLAVYELEEMKCEEAEKKSNANKASALFKPVSFSDSKGVITVEILNVLVDKTAVSKGKAYDIQLAEAVKRGMRVIYIEVKITNNTSTDELRFGFLDFKLKANNGDIFAANPPAGEMLSGGIHRGRSITGGMEFLIYSDLSPEALIMRPIGYNIQAVLSNFAKIVEEAKNR